MILTGTLCSCLKSLQKTAVPRPGENKHVLITESSYFLFFPEYKPRQASGADHVSLMDTFTGKNSRKLRISSPATCNVLSRQPNQFALLSQKSFLKAVIQYFILSAVCQHFLFKVTLNLIFYFLSAIQTCEKKCAKSTYKIRLAFQRWDLSRIIE